jgi:hypothetical protein
VGWREGTLTRATELETLCAWIFTTSQDRSSMEFMKTAIQAHLDAAREAATAAELNPRKRLRRLRNASLLERAMSNLDAAEAELLNVAPGDYVLGQMPSLLAKVQCHLVPGDPRRQELERIARALNLLEPDTRPRETYKAEQVRIAAEIVDACRGRIVTATRAAASAALREQVRVRSFRNVIVVSTAFMTLLAVSVAVLGWLNPTAIPLCFAPEKAGETLVVCPTAQSAPFPASAQTPVDQAGGVPSARPRAPRQRTSTTP